MTLVERLQLYSPAGPTHPYAALIERHIRHLCTVHSIKKVPLTTAPSLCVCVVCVCGHVYDPQLMPCFAAHVYSSRFGGTCCITCRRWRSSCWSG